MHSADKTNISDFYRPPLRFKRLYGRWVGLLLSMALGTAAWVGSAVGAADPRASIAVLYPDIGEPYRSVFTQIINGVEEETGNRVSSYPIGPGYDAQQLSSELQRRDIRVLIALGRNGLNAATALNRDVGIVAGGVLSIPDQTTRNLSVLSLAPDPALLFKQLKTLAPGIKRVVVVYDPHQNGWLIQLAREAATAQGLELLAHEASDLKTALQKYNTVLAEANPKRDALWLPQDSTTVEESTILPVVLQEAWNRNLLFFSSSVVHVKRGALFALYPNNQGLGRSLASSALKQLSAEGQPMKSVAPLRDVLIAVNVRTASHLGLNLSDTRQKFDLVFPAQ